MHRANEDEPVSVLLLLVTQEDVSTAHDVMRLLEDAGFAVQWRASERGSVEPRASVDFAVILVVSVDPAGEAVQVCRETRHQGADVPILLLTGPDRMQQNLECFAAGIDDVLAAPFHSPELIARVRALARRRAIPGPAVPRLQAGAIFVDEGEGQAYLDTERLDLTQRELQLLRQLLLNKGRTQSRQALFARIWGTRYDPESNLIDVHIQHLRQKLGKASGRLVTVRGQGYAITG